MNNRKYDLIRMKMESIAWYSIYVDCLSRLINEIIENGENNLKPNDLPNLCELLSKLAFRLNKKILNVKCDIEFY